METNDTKRRLDDAAEKVGIAWADAQTSANQIGIVPADKKAIIKQTMLAWKIAYEQHFGHPPKL